ncbi:hypothetical protein [Desulfosporosinus meridiei]|uniref:Uncharacterized protein n=1 Tax=Desulfosporosinus meridiei (strain ATCC BAA-275 / DSM 13257 / KCTC 12902 / NCIMB 13706 / S10) TaxID=768704 RepID=J7J2Q5_DESMD|nr:hypothetical protein [Desulfosporosinus meridiei]AFQ45256.1 hypothetical protein Desmer_3398 [Desulfosporosinus meridiei DSM 13257]
MKKVLTMIISAMLLLSVTIPAVAASDNAKFSNHSEVKARDDVSVKEIYNGVSPTEPTDQTKDITPQGTGIPTSVWNIVDNGQYDFSGYSNYQVLYTNYKFTGKTSYTVRITNTGSSNLILKAKNILSTYLTETLEPGHSYGFRVDVPSSTTQFYLLFDGGGSSISFDGFIY